MINGNIDEFVDKLWGGKKLFIPIMEKYFSQGYTQENGDYYSFTTLYNLMPKTG